MSTMYLLQAKTAVVRIGTSGTCLDEQMVLLLCFVTAVTDGESSCLRKALFDSVIWSSLG